MGTYFNPGSDRFQDCLDRKIFVDKSGILDYTNECIRNKDRYLCLTRPRRFGKSTTANMLVAYYGRGCDSHTQFDGLAISKCKSYDDNLNKYNVVRVDMNELLGDWGAGYSTTEILDKLTESLTEELEEVYPDISRGKEPFAGLLDKIYSKTKIRFVFVIDEWDAVFRNRADDVPGQKSYIHFINAILKDQPYVALAYMTGILPIKRYGDQSALNMFQEISMTDAYPVQEYTGFTEKEVKKLCKNFKRSFEDIKYWYDGYNVNGVSVYNPKAVDEAVRSGVLKNYWTKTLEYDVLKGYLEENRHGIHDAVISLVAGDKIGVDAFGFSTDLQSFGTRDEILTLLVHLGYLTYDNETKTVWIPNHEIHEEFDSVVKQIKLKTTLKTDFDSERLFNATLLKDTDAILEIISPLHQENTDSFTVGIESPFKTVISMAYSYARQYYSIVREMPVQGGRADFVFISNGVKPDLPLIIMEVKDNENDNAADAIAQIRKEHYTDCLPAYSGRMLLMGISYNTKHKVYTCVIEEEERIA
ncbi:MAG: AAA family ATPase [Clostridia bacterium]|nr:AAA family ATPase [Clostridia bacterium]